jgi:SagB-type dehydrogenase family enzyme
VKRKRREAPFMKFRRAATLTATFQDGRIALHNFMTRDDFTCSIVCLEFLSKLDDWHTPEDLFSHFPDADHSSLARQIPELIRFNALVIAGTPQAERDEKYRREWQWGASAGSFHFSVRDTRFVTGKPARDFMRKRKTWRPSPKLFQSNAGRNPMKLPATNIRSEPFALMHRRRSQREFDGKPIALSALADCLFAGNGIVGFREDDVYGRLPIAMTPSGGARNPFELYVYAQNINGLKPGFYHYGSLKYDIGLVRAGNVDVPAMLGTQKWPAKAGAIVFLVAHFPRSMWKYHMPIAYRVVMMEAGFIGQNIALAATHHGLSAVPSGALNEDLIEAYLGIPAVESAVVLSLSLGRPRTQVD